MKTAESTRDVKEKRRYSLTSVTTLGRCNKTAERPIVADVTRLPLRSHKSGCYSSPNPKGWSRVYDYFFLISGDIGGDGVFGNAYRYRFEVSEVPLPPALLLFATALGGMAVASYRRRKNGGAQA